MGGDRVHSGSLNSFHMSFFTLHRVVLGSFIYWFSFFSVNFILRLFSLAKLGPDSGEYVICAPPSSSCCPWIRSKSMLNLGMDLKIFVKGEKTVGKGYDHLFLPFNEEARCPKEIQNFNIRTLKSFPI